MIVNSPEDTLSSIPRYQDNEDQFLRISIEDTGVGIKKKDQDKLFKLFGFV